MRKLHVTEEKTGHTATVFRSDYAANILLQNLGGDRHETLEREVREETGFAGWIDIVEIEQVESVDQIPQGSTFADALDGPTNETNFWLAKANEGFGFGWKHAKPWGDGFILGLTPKDMSENCGKGFSHQAFFYPVVRKDNPERNPS